MAHIHWSDRQTGSIIHSSDDHPTWIYRGVDTPYYSEVMTGGDTCDLTGKPRRTEFRFICDPKTLHSFESISETETCTYLGVIHTSLLCDHPGTNHSGEGTKSTQAHIPRRRHDRF